MAQPVLHNGSQVVMIPLDELMAFGENIAEQVFRKLSVEKKETYLTTKQAALKLGVDVSTLYRWDKGNYLNPVRVGSKKRYRLSDIENLLKIK